MALPTSGQLSLEDIATELQVSISDVSLRSMSSSAGFTTPDSVSEFYGYSAAPRTNLYYYSNDGVNDYIKGTWSGQTSLHNNDWSIRFFVRQNQTSKSSQQLWDFNSNATLNSGDTKNRVFLQYQGNNNKFIARVRTNTSNFDRQWNLHSNSSVTGITSSATGWTSGQRGNVNSDNMCMLTLTYDSSQTNAANAFKLYWNDSEMTTQRSALSGSRNAATFASLSLCASQHNISGGNANVDYDEWAFYDSVLTSTQVATLWNSGTSEDASTLLTTSLSESLRFDAGNAVDPYGSDYSGTITGGSTVAY